MKFPRRRFLRLAVAAAVLPAAARMAAAQNYPTRPVRVIVPYPPGGNADVVGRVVARTLQAELGQPFVIENKPGAGGLIGADAVAKSAPDGYTLLLSANGPILYAPEMADRKPYEWRRDFAPIGTISLTSLVLLVHPAVPAATFKEFIEYVRREGAKVTFASGGAGSSNHLLSELIRSQLDLNWTTAQYRGTAPAMNDLIGGHVQFSIDQVSASLPLIKDGRVRALAVSGSKRVPWLPDIPTFVELGYKDLVGYTFAALVAPAGTPQDIISRLSGALTKAVRDPQVAQQINTLGAEPEVMTPDEFKAYLEREDAIWLPVVRKASKPQ
jgi:tripartite-type tricarboxylate transporter receptor subunit TctC